MDRVTVVLDLSACSHAQAGTREHEPYTFESGCTELVRRALPAGDYSLEGHEDSVAVFLRDIQVEMAFLRRLSFLVRDAESLSSCSQNRNTIQPIP